PWKWPTGAMSWSRGGSSWRALRRSSWTTPRCRKLISAALLPLPSPIPVEPALEWRRCRWTHPGALAGGGRSTHYGGPEGPALAIPARDLHLLVSFGRAGRRLRHELKPKPVLRPGSGPGGIGGSRAVGRNPGRTAGRGAAGAGNGDGGNHSAVAHRGADPGRGNGVPAALTRHGAGPPR